MIELLSTLTWPGAAAIIGSVITMVTGAIALYGSYLKSTIKQEPPKSILTEESVQLIHSRISDLKDRVGDLEGDQKVLVSKLESIAKELADHSKRDLDDFKTINAKVDKLMEIIVEMLRDDH